MADKQDQRIVIVSGLPRTGTSMMMRMLEAGGMPILTDYVRKPDEDNPRGYYEFEPVKRTKQDPSWLAQAVGKAVKMVHVLLYDLPLDRDYHVIFTTRKLEEVIASQNVMLDRQGKAAGDLSDEQLIKAFSVQLAKLDRWLAERPNFHVLRVNYNDTLKDPATTVRAVNDFLGGVLDTQSMLRVVEPSLYRQRK